MTNRPPGERIAALEALVPGMAGKVDETHTIVHEMKGKLETFIDQMAKADERHSKLEARTGKLENRQHFYAGIAAFAGVVLGAFGVHVKP